MLGSKSECGWGDCGKEKLGKVCKELSLARSPEFCVKVEVPLARRDAEVSRVGKPWMLWGGRKGWGFKTGTSEVPKRWNLFRFAEGEVGIPVSFCTIALKLVVSAERMVMGTLLAALDLRLCTLVVVAPRDA